MIPQRLRILLTLSVASFFLTACPKEIGDVKIYSVDPDVGLVRDQDKEVIPFSDIRRGDYFAVSDSDMRALLDLANSCQSEDE